MSEAAVIRLLAATRLVPVIVIEEARTAPELAAALRRGGQGCAEITLRTPAAVEAIAAMARQPGMLVGAGTVLTPGQADEAIAAGARFIVSPGFSPAVVRHCQDRSVPVFPGVATATEIQLALEAGLRVVKFFPAEPLGGAGLLRALAAPFAAMGFIPTGGVGPGNLAGYLRLPAVTAVGGSWLATRELLRAGDFAQITRLTAEAVELARPVPGTGAPAGPSAAGPQ